MAPVSAQADPLTLARPTVSDLELDDRTLERIVADAGVSLNGSVRTDVVGGAGSETEQALAWLEPPPGVEPTTATLCRLRVEGPDADAWLVAPTQVFERDEGLLVRAVYYTLTLAIGTMSDLHILRWWLEPGGDAAGPRADALRFLEALHRPGHLLVDELTTGRRWGHLPLSEAPFDEELRQARGFLEQIALLEEWTGQPVPMPIAASASEVTEVARTVAIVKSRVVPLTLPEEGTLTLRDVADDDLPPGDVVDLSLHRDVVTEALGVELPLGSVDLALRVRVSGARREGDAVTVSFALAPDQPRTVFGHLYPPATRARRLRRSLVAGAPLPADVLAIEMRAEELRLAAADRFLEEELGCAARPLPADVVADVEAKWPA